MSTLNIGVVGYSGTPFNEAEAVRLLNQGLDVILDVNPEVTEVYLVSGLTNLGIPALAYRIAVERGWKTVGVACAKAEDNECFDVDESIIIGANWGDESETFLEMSHVLLKVGGGRQSIREAADFQQMGGKVYEYDLARLDR